MRIGGRIKLMEPESGGRSGFSLTRFGLRGSAGLVVAVAVVAILLIALPALSLVLPDQLSDWTSHRGRPRSLA